LPRGEHRQNTLQHKSQQDPLYPSPRILEIKAKIYKWDLIKIKSICTTKETISKVKRQPSEWEKIIADEATDKGNLDCFDSFTIGNNIAMNIGV